jgi:predicted MFS family arabinose efflux permease
VVSAAAYGIGFMVGGTLLSVWSSTVFVDNPTRGFSVVITCIAVGSIIGPPLFGLVVDHFGTPAAFAVATVVALATVAACPRRPR